MTKRKSDPGPKGGRGRPRQSRIDRFWAKVDRSGGEASCWPWTAARDRQGYGRFYDDDKQIAAHRVAYTLAVGPIGDLDVLHSCDNPACCNPAHLSAGTAAHNSDDLVGKRRSAEQAGLRTVARGRVRIHKGAYELSAYSGTNPTSGREQRIYQRLPLGTSQKEIDEALARLIVKGDDLARIRRIRRRDGGHVDPEPVDGRGRKVRHALDVWWAQHGQRLHRAKNARQLMDAYLYPTLGDVDLWRLRPALDPEARERDPDLVDLSAFADGLLAAGAVGHPGKDGPRTGAGAPLAPSTVHKVMRILTGALALEVARPGTKLIANPAAGIKLPPIADRPSSTPDADELAQFLPILRGEGRTVSSYKVTRRVRNSEKVITYEVAAKPDPGGPARHVQLHAYALLVASGPRPQEVSGLTRGDIDLATGRVHLQAVGVDDEGTVHRGETSKRRKRVVLLDPATLAAVADHIRYQDEAALLCGLRLGRRAWLFSPEPDCSEPMTPELASEGFAKAITAARKMGVDLPPKMRLYDMRHFGITQLLDKGHRHRAVADRFGTSEKMLTTKYSHATPGDDERLAESMSQVWGAVLRPAADGTVIRLRP